MGYTFREIYTAYNETPLLERNTSMNANKVAGTVYSVYALAGFALAGWGWSRLRSLKAAKKATKN